MKTLRSTFIVLSIVALALIVAPVAMANTVTYTSNTVPDSTSISNSMGTLGLTQFNNISGTYAGTTLNSILVTLYGDGSVTFYAELVNNGGSGGNLTVDSLTADVTLKATGAVSPVSLLLVGTYTPGSPIVITTEGLPGKVTTPTTAIPLGDVTSGTLTDALDLANFTGTGTVNLSLSGLAPVFYTGTVSDGYLAAVGGVTDAGGYATVTYNYSDYTPPGVPEPSTLSMFGAGLLGLAGMLRSKFSKS